MIDLKDVFKVEDPFEGQLKMEHRGQGRYGKRGKRGKRDDDDDDDDNDDYDDDDKDDDDDDRRRMLKHPPGTDPPGRDG